MLDKGINPTIGVLDACHTFLLYLCLWGQHSNRVCGIQCMYSLQFIAGVEINYFYFQCIILLIRKHLAICITKKCLLLLAFQSHLYPTINPKL